MAISVLGKGSLAAASPINVLTAGTGETKSISNFVLCNTSASAISVTVSILDASDVGTQATIVNLPAASGSSRIVAECIGGIGAGYKVRLTPSAATGVDYTIFGSVSAS